MAQASRAKIKKQKIMPRVVEKNAKRMLSNLELGRSITESNLIDNTGKTHGITFRIKPPRRAKKM